MSYASQQSSPSDMSPAATVPANDPIAQVKQASAQWVASFNRGDAETCTKAYTDDAVMTVTPMGTFTGHAEILAFWRQIVADGANTLVYRDIKMQTLAENTVRLSASWTMNIGHGIITDETWFRQPSGVWKLLRDSFEVQGWQSKNS